MKRIIPMILPLYAWLCALVLTGAVAFMAFHLLRGALPACSTRLIFGDTAVIDAILLRRQVFDGLFPALFGTLTLVIAAVTIALPLGVGAGIYLAEYAGTTTRRLLMICFDLLASIPSIVIGLAGFAVVMLLHRDFYRQASACLLLSAICLAFLVTPYLVRSTQTALEQTEPTLRSAAIVLGASKLQNLFLVLLPHRINVIASGVFLALGRCAEDTAVIMLTGVVVAAGVPSSPGSPYEALPFFIYYISSQYSDKAELSSGYAAAVMLVLICAILLLGAFVLQRQLGGRLFKR